MNREAILILTVPDRNLFRNWSAKVPCDEILQHSWLINANGREKIWITLSHERLLTSPSHGDELLDRIWRKSSFIELVWLIRLINPNAPKEFRWNSCYIAGKITTGVQGHHMARLRKRESRKIRKAEDGLGSMASLSICLRPLVMSSFGSLWKK